MLLLLLLGLGTEKVVASSRLCCCQGDDLEEHEDMSTMSMLTIGDAMMGVMFIEVHGWGLWGRFQSHMARLVAPHSPEFSDCKCNELILNFSTQQTPGVYVHLGVVILSRVPYSDPYETKTSI